MSIGDPHGRMEEHDAAGHGGKTIPKVVMPPDVGQFMAQHVNELLARDLRDESARHDYTWPPPASGGGRVKCWSDEQVAGADTRFAAKVGEGGGEIGRRHL